MLTNPYYNGIVTMNGAQHAGLHEPLFSAATWDAVQRLLSARRNGERSRTHTHYLKSTIYCFNCHRRLLVHKARSKSGRIYDYFVCSGRQKTPKCTQQALLIADVERRVEAAYSLVEISGARRWQIRQSHQRRLDRDVYDKDQRLAELDKQADVIASRQTKLLDLYYSDSIPREILTKEQKKLSQELARITGERERLSEDAISIVQRMDDVLDLLEDAHARYLSATADARKQMNNALFSRIFIGPADEDLCVEMCAEVSEILAG